MSVKPKQKGNTTVSSNLVALCWIHPGHCDAAFMDSVFHLLTSKRGRETVGAVISQETGIGICEGRNLIAAKFLQTGIEWMLMLDSDIAFQPDLFERLLESANKTTIATALYFAWNRHTRDIRPTVYDADLKVLQDWPRDRSFQVGACGAGCMLIHRSVFEKFDKPWFEQAPDGSYLEDVGFCINANEAGIKIMCDPRIPLGHAKAFIVGQGDWWAYKQMKEAENAEQTSADILTVGSN